VIVVIAYAAFAMLRSAIRKSQSNFEPRTLLATDANT